MKNFKVGDRIALRGTITNTKDPCGIVVLFDSHIRSRVIEREAMKEASRLVPRKNGGMVSLMKANARAQELEQQLKEIRKRWTIFRMSIGPERPLAHHELALQTAINGTALRLEGQ